VQWDVLSAQTVSITSLRSDEFSRAAGCRFPKQAQPTIKELTMQRQLAAKVTSQVTTTGSHALSYLVVPALDPHLEHSKQAFLDPIDLRLDERKARRHQVRCRLMTISRWIRTLDAPASDPRVHQFRTDHVDARRSPPVQHMGAPHDPSTAEKGCSGDRCGAGASASNPT
jgi:hypothetical protein